MIDKNDPRLTAYLLDELDDESAGEVQAAIEASPELREHVDGLRSTIGTLQNSLQNTLASSGDAVLSSGQLAQIDQAASTVSVANTNAAGDTDSRSRWRIAALAALVLYAVGTVSYTHLTLPTKRIV